MYGTVIVDCMDATYSVDEEGRDGFCYTISGDPDTKIKVAIWCGLEKEVKIIRLAELNDA